MRTSNDVLLQVVAEHGSVPPPDVIRDLVGAAAEDDSFLSSDLIDDALADADAGTPADLLNDRFLADVRKDQDALANLAVRLQRLQDAPDPKLQTLKSVLAETPSRKVAIFTAFQDTAIYLRDQFERQPDLLADRTWTVVIGAQVDPKRSHPRTRTLLSHLGHG